MCQTTNKILHAMAPMSDADIAAGIEKYTGEACSLDRVQKWRSGKTGIPLDQIGALFSALGLKVVDTEDQTIDPADLAALKRWAKRGIDA